MTKTILVIEDDASIRQGIVDALAFAGYTTQQAATVADGLDQALGADCDLILLDLVLPGGKGSQALGAAADGLDILAKVRKTRPTLPVIVLTTGGEESDRIKGLKLGADDYVVKPFRVDELLARVEAVLRRSPQRPKDISTVTLQGVRADLNAALVRFDDGDTCALAERKVDLLRYLAQNAGRPSRAMSYSHTSGVSIPTA